MTKPTELRELTDDALLHKLPFKTRFVVRQEEA